MLIFKTRIDYLHIKTQTSLGFMWSAPWLLITPMLTYLLKMLIFRNVRTTSSGMDGLSQANFRYLLFCIFERSNTCTL
ncbi:hypothetical protein DAI22_11g007300 [Oryza sativa Japonica Group]|nr:hypothetical protein DAI22_11g007300 [Oryza sativa Japonica Group]